MPNSTNQIELVVTVEVDKANKSIKSVNASLNSIEAAATKSARGAASGIDGMTASMIKGATAGNLLAEGIKKALGWVKDLTIETAKYAARTDVLAIVTQQLAKVNNLSAAGVNLLVGQIKDLGITTQEAHGVIQRMIFAELDLGKAAKLADVARNAAVIAGVDTSMALENIILGITTGQTRLLHNMGLQVSLLNVEAAASKELGRQLTDQEKREAMLNAVIKEGAKIRGTYPAAMELVGKQMTSLPRYFKEAANAIGKDFQPALKTVVDTLKDLASWLQDNAAQVADFAKVIAGIVAAGAVGILTTTVWGLVGALGALGAAAMANPIGLIAAGVALAGGIVYSEWRRMQQPFDAMDAAYKRMLTSQITGARTGADLKSATEKVEKAFENGAIDAKAYAQALDMLDAAQARVNGWTDLSDLSRARGINIKVKDPKAEAAAAQALAEEVGKAQLANETAFRNRALEAGKAGLTGYAKDVADVNAEIQKRTMLVDAQGQSHQFKLTGSAWASILDELQKKFQAFKDHFAEENKKALADQLKDEDEKRRQEMGYEAKRFQDRLKHDTEIAEKDLDHLRDVYAFEGQRAGFARDARLRQLDGADAVTLRQKVAVEQQKAQIEIEYLQKVHEVKQTLYDMDTRRMLLEEKLTLKRLGYNADEVKAQIAELTDERKDIRGQGDEANDAAIRAAREDASTRSAQLVRDHNRQIFESIKQQAGGVFDALLTKSQSVWKAIGFTFKTAILTAMKEVITSRIAAVFTELVTGEPAKVAGGGKGSILSKLPRFAEGGITTGPSIAGEAGPELIIPLDRLWNMGLPRSVNLVGHYGPETDAALQKAAMAMFQVGLPAGLTAMGGPAGFSVGGGLMALLTGGVAAATPERKDGMMLGMAPMGPPGAGGYASLSDEAKVVRLGNLAKQIVKTDSPGNVLNDSLGSVAIAPSQRFTLPGATSRMWDGGIVRDVYNPLLPASRQRITTVGIPDELRGQGLGQALYLAAMKHGPINWEEPFGSLKLTENSSQVRAALLRKGLAERDGDWMRLTDRARELLGLEQISGSASLRAPRDLVYVRKPKVDVGKPKTGARGVGDPESEWYWQAGGRDTWGQTHEQRQSLGRKGGLKSAETRIQMMAARDPELDASGRYIGRPVDVPETAHAASTLLDALFPRLAHIFDKSEADIAHQISSAKGGSMSKGRIRSKLPEYDDGGMVASTGLALVHRGEAVVPHADTMKKSIEANTAAIRGNSQSPGQLGRAMAAMTAMARAAVGGWSPATRGVASVFLNGIGAMPVFGGTGGTGGTGGGGPVQGGAAGGWGTPPFVPGGGGGAAMGGGGGAAGAGGGGGGIVSSNSGILGKWPNPGCPFSGRYNRVAVHGGTTNDYL